MPHLEVGPTSTNVPQQTAAVCSEDPNVLKKDLPPFLAKALSLDVFEGAAEFRIVSPDLVPSWAGISPRLDDLRCASARMICIASLGSRSKRFTLGFLGMLGRDMVRRGIGATSSTTSNVGLMGLLTTLPIALRHPCELGISSAVSATDTMHHPAGLSRPKRLLVNLLELWHFSMPQKRLLVVKDKVCLLFPD